MRGDFVIVPRSLLPRTLARLHLEYPKRACERKGTLWYFQNTVKKLGAALLTVRAGLSK